MSFARVKNGRRVPRASSILQLQPLVYLSSLLIEKQFAFPAKLVFRMIAFDIETVSCLQLGGSE